MTEAEWQNARHPDRMLALVRERMSPRKSRLFACACCRRLGTLLTDECLETIQLLEHDADTPLPADATDAVAMEAMAHADDLSYAMGSPEGCGRWLAADAVYDAFGRNYVGVAENVAAGAARAVETANINPAAFDVTKPGTPTDGDWEERAAHADLLRCLVGNPFRPVAVDPEWQTATVLELARGIYADRTWDRLSVLADALEDAGCTHPDLIGHLRGPGPHARGCWPVDLLLGRS